MEDKKTNKKEPKLSVFVIYKLNENFDSGCW
jgi:hypothetical protein